MIKYIVYRIYITLEIVNNLKMWFSKNSFKTTDLGYENETGLDLTQEFLQT